ncbi:HAD-IC family P-type ATPase [Schaalia georgiae]|uniref:HAD-IC family P-type ATPase n=1 Tax=Schaalia georgiae TaxID=52768 RepID=UPI000409F663|nr:HAD-IC family P-type ATPase [Schaalia georgiae]
MTTTTTDPAAVPTARAATTRIDQDAPRIGQGARRTARELARRLTISAPLGLFAMAVSMVPAWQFPGWQWAVALASVPVVTWGAWPFHRAAFAAGRHGSTTMDTLVSLGVIASTLWSWWALLLGGAGEVGMRMSMSLVPRASHSGHAEIYFEGACMIVVFLLTGRWMEARARYRAGDALRALLELGVTEATLVEQGPDGGRVERTVPASSLSVGDLFLVRPGQKVATDGVVVSGASAIDASLLTGESVPVDVREGDAVTGATVNTWGALTVRATRVGADTALSQIGRMVAEAQAGKAPVQRLADRISGVFVPVVIAVSLLTAIGWLASGAALQVALTSAVAVLVVACPCALGLATPTALLVGSGRASQLGIVIRNAEALERTRRIDTALLDKTGTVTTGRMSLESALGAPGVADSELLRMAAGAEAASEHPLARAIVAGAAERGIAPAATSAFTNQAGLGVCAVLDSEAGALALVGRASWLESLGVSIDGALADRLRGAEASGASAVVVAVVEDWEHTPAAPVPGARRAGRSVDDGTARSADDRAVPGATTVTMSVGGMTCASCVRRVERKLGKLPGVSASVNLATESARITLTRPYSDQELEGVVGAAGYQGAVTSRVEDGGQAADAATARVDAAGMSVGAIAGVDAGVPAAGAIARQMGTRESVGSGVAPQGSGDAPQPGPGPDSPVIALPERLTGARVLGVLVVRDTVKPTSRAAIAQLRSLGIEPVLLTGDNEAAARHVASQVGIDRVIAGVLPDGKRAAVAELQERGAVVAMVGDGVNDAAALAQASLGIAMGSGTDVAIEASDITLAGSDLASAATAIRISRRTLHVIKENLFWAFFYNVAMVPLAIAGLLSPMLASAAMACSSVFVVLNSLRLRSAS